MKKISGIVIIVLLICNCAANKSTNNIQTSNAGKKGLINENFDPLILNDDDLTIKKKKLVDAKSDFNEAMVSSSEETIDIDKNIDGYRVQICAIADKEAARDIQREAILKFNEDIYLTYDSPYYKVRIGDCTTRFEADKLQRLAVEKGFDDAWVVKTKVNVKPKSEEEESLLGP